MPERWRKCATGAAENLEWFRFNVAQKYEIKHSVVGPGVHDAKEVRVLNRIIRWTDDGIDGRGADESIEKLY